MNTRLKALGNFYPNYFQSEQLRVTMLTAVRKFGARNQFFFLGNEAMGRETL